MILPSPAPAFAWVETVHGPGLVCRPLEAVAPHLFTTRHWRLGVGIAAGADEPWDDVAAVLAVDEARLIRVQQVHGADVAVARNGAASRQDADILLTVDPQLALAVRVADCVPLVLADQRTGAVAAAHAGWRGLALGVPGAVVAALTREGGSRPGDLIAAAGPSIGACCYEVGSDVRASFERAGFGPRDLGRWFQTTPVPTARNPSMPGLSGPRGDHWFFDGWASTEDQLIAAGLPASQIFIAGLCTASHPDAFCSYRRDGAPAGRLAAAITGPRLRP